MDSLLVSGAVASFLRDVYLSGAAWGTRSRLERTHGLCLPACSSVEHRTRPDGPLPLQQHGTSLRAVTRPVC